MGTGGLFSSSPGTFGFEAPVMTASSSMIRRFAEAAAWSRRSASTIAASMRVSSTGDTRAVVRDDPDVRLQDEHEGAKDGDGAVDHALGLTRWAA